MHIRARTLSILKIIYLIYQNERRVTMKDYQASELANLRKSDTHDILGKLQIEIREKSKKLNKT